MDEDLTADGAMTVRERDERLALIRMQFANSPVVDELIAERHAEAEREDRRE